MRQACTSEIDTPNTDPTQVLLEVPILVSGALSKSYGHLWTPDVCVFNPVKFTVCCYRTC